MALIIPCLYDEIGTAALDGIISELAGADYLDLIVIGLDDATESEFHRAKEFFGRLPQRHMILWNDGPRLQAVNDRLASRGLAPIQRGKGSNVWYCLGAVLADGRAQVVAQHDADIVGYSRALLARLIYPVAHPGFGYRFAKGYYHRITGNQFGGRATRLLLAPLLRALHDVIGDEPYLRYLDAFRYSLAGESAMDIEIAAGLRVPGHWGLEIGVLSEIYRQIDLDAICQVDVAAAYDHKHQDLSPDDSSRGLRKMSADVAATVIRRLGVDGAIIDESTVDGIRDAYEESAYALVRHYGNDAELNGYVADEAGDKAIIDAFSRSVHEAGMAYLANPMDTPFNPSWERVFRAMPDVAVELTSAIAQDKVESAKRGAKTAVRAPDAASSWSVSGRIGRPPMVLHGVVNASPDSLADFSVAITVDEAVARSELLLEQGCVGIDLGGAGSTEYADRVDIEEEWQRLDGKIQAISELGCELSVDTWQPEVMRRAFDVGATIMNAADGLQEPEMVDLAAELGVPVVLPFLSGIDPKALVPVQGDPVTRIVDWFGGAVSALEGAGVSRSQLIIDPGTGFGPADWD